MLDRQGFQLNMPQKYFGLVPATEFPQKSIKNFLKRNTLKTSRKTLLATDDIGYVSL
jgi:hypothetical protein